MKKYAKVIKAWFKFLTGGYIYSESPIHEYFGLSYASYQVCPRSVLQSMPIKWQRKFVSLLDEIDNKGYICPTEGHYEVMVRDNMGRYIHDPYQDYERGRRIVKPIAKTERKVKPAKSKQLIFR